MYLREGVCCYLEDRKLKTRTVKGEKSEEYIKVPRYQLRVGTTSDEPAVLCYAGY